MLQVGWLTSQTETISTVYANRSDGWASLDGRRNVPDWPIRDSVHHLLNSYCRNSTSNFAEGVRNTQCFSNPTRCAALNFFRIQTGSVRFTDAAIGFLQFIFRFTILYIFTLHHLSVIVLSKNHFFLLRLNSKLRVKIRFSFNVSP